MKIFKYVSIIASLVLLGGESSKASESKFEVSEVVKKKIEKFVGKSAKTNYFKSESGLIGVALTMKNGKQRVIYSTSDGEHLIAGMMVNTSTGSSITPKEVEKYAPKPDYSALLNNLKSSKTIQSGNKDSDNELYVFVDANCGICHSIYSDINKLLDEGEDINVKWVPVAIMGGDSENKAQGLLGVDDTKKGISLKAVMQKLPYVPKEEDVAEGRLKLAQNMNIFSAYGFGGVPVVVRKYKGKDIKIFPGKPKVDVMRAPK